MVEKKLLEENESKKERFEFAFTVNGNFICQRYFWITNFNEHSLGSTRLTDAIENCVDMINGDLKKKSNIYNWYAAPQVFASKGEMEKWVENPTFNLEVPSYVLVNGCEETYVWNGESMEVYDKPYNKADFTKDCIDNTPCIFKFAFLCDGKEVRSISWDGSCYPRFVRSNIDISNSRNKYKNKDKEKSGYVSMEEFLIDKFIKANVDLIPLIVKEICSACSIRDEKYNYTVNYGGKEYCINIAKANADYFSKLENIYRKKTKAYFNSL